jgi:LysR family transcriptional activator of nhaA
LIVPSDDKSVFSRSIGRLKVGVYGNKKFLSLKKGFPFSLKNQPMILPTLHSKVRHDIDHYFLNIKTNVHILSEVQDTTVQKILAEKGEGLIVEPELSVTEPLKEKKLYKLGYLDGVYEEFFLSSTKRVISNPIVTFLMKEYKLNRPKHEYFD